MGNYNDEQVKLRMTIDIKLHLKKIVVDGEDRIALKYMI